MARQNSPRMRKVNELIREVVADAVPGLKDPRIGFVTITGAETSPDLRYAIVFYSAMGSEQEKTETAAGLKSAIPHLQREIGREVRLRNTPKLEFRVDPAIDEGLKINELVKELDLGVTDDRRPTTDDPTETAGSESREGQAESEEEITDHRFQIPNESDESDPTSMIEDRVDPGDGDA